jgi:hypothetical protein
MGNSLGIEHLPTMYRALGSNPSIVKKKKKKDNLIVNSKY